MNEINFIILDYNKNTIHSHKCTFCNKYAQYYRHKENDYICREHLFGKTNQYKKDMQHELNVEHFHEKGTLVKCYGNNSLKRKTTEEYKVMNKELLLKSLFSFMGNFDRLREQLVEIKLENNFLKRKVALLKNKLSEKGKRFKK